MSLLGLYIHVPFCVGICPYCDFYSLDVSGAGGGGALERFSRLAAIEIERLAEAHGDEVAGRAVETIYFGGGTPSLLSPESVARVLEAARGRLTVAPDCEITMESSPEATRRDWLSAWRAAGVNRMSVGVQSFDDGVLRSLGRRHTADQARDLVRLARERGFDNVSMDLMFAAPGQTRATWLATVDEAVGRRPEHISFYGLTIHDGTPFGEAAAAGRLVMPDDESQADDYLAARRRLIAAGFEAYEISNFALPGRRSRHNQNYWLGGDWLAAGPAAHASLGPWRWENPSSFAEWSSSLEAGRLPRAAPRRATPDDIRAERILTVLRHVDGLDLDALAHSTGQDPRADRADRLTRLVDSGLVYWTPGGRLALTERGILVSDAVIAELA